CVGRPAGRIVGRKGQEFSYGLKRFGGATMKHHVPAALLASASVVFAVPARADQVVLDNGEVLDGRALEDGDSVVVLLDIGTVTLAKREIREIKKSDTALDEWQKRHDGAKTDTP